jgi:hypothetical protein
VRGSNAELYELVDQLANITLEHTQMLTSHTKMIDQLTAVVKAQSKLIGNLEARLAKIDGIEP